MRMVAAMVMELEKHGRHHEKDAAGFAGSIIVHESGGNPGVMRGPTGEAREKSFRRRFA